MFKAIQADGHGMRTCESGRVFTIYGHTDSISLVTCMADFKLDMHDEWGFQIGFEAEKPLISELLMIP